MKKTEIMEIIMKTSKDFLDGKIGGDGYRSQIESLIMTNIKKVPELEDFADFLAQYSENRRGVLELYSTRDLKNEIRKRFNL